MYNYAIIPKKKLYYKTIKILKFMVQMLKQHQQLLYSIYYNYKNIRFLFLCFRYLLSKSSKLPTVSNIKVLCPKI